MRLATYAQEEGWPFRCRNRRGNSQIACVGLGMVRDRPDRSRILSL